MTAKTLYEQVGFDYIAAINDLLRKFTYLEIASHVGYKSTGSITAVLEGKTPSHRHGEALWALYCDTFGRKPPMVAQQSANLVTERIS